MPMCMCMCGIHMYATYGICMRGPDVNAAAVTREQDAIVYVYQCLSLGGVGTQHLS